MNTSLNGMWKFVEDPSNDGLEKGWWKPDWIDSKFDSMEEIELPNCWNIVEGFDKYEGIMWFYKEFMDIPKYSTNDDLYIRFKAANYQTKVWIDEAYLGEHNGGFLPFKFEIVPEILNLREKHYIIVRVENHRKKDRIPCESFDWYNWGGIYRDIDFQVLDKLRIEWAGVSSHLVSDQRATLTINYDIIDNRDIRSPDSEFQAEILWSLYYLGDLSSERETQLKASHSKKPESIEDKKNDDGSKRGEDTPFEIPDTMGDVDIEEPEEMDVLDNLIREHTDMDFFASAVDETKTAAVEGALIKSGTYETNASVKSGSFHIEVEEPNFWWPDSPELYQVGLVLKNSSHQTVLRFGIREVRTDGTKLLLNNKRIFLHGVSLHEELNPYGRAIPEEKRRRDVLDIKKLGLNAIRTGHYPHDGSMYSIMDEEGLLAFEEIPVYWGIAFDNLDTLAQAKKMMKTLIRRDYNHPSIIMWSCGNEIPVGGDPDCANFISNLGQFARKLDKSRLISWVSLPSLTSIPKKLKPTTDLYNLNMYFGWYYLSPYNINFILDTIHAANLNKPIVVSEFGAGAKLGFHKPVKKFKKFSEERQASVISHQIKVINSKDYCAGWFIWIYRDFRSHRRVNQYQEGYNRKGIVSEKNEKKLIAKWMPTLHDQSFSKTELSDHQFLAMLFRTLGWPLFKFIHIMTALFQRLSGKFHGGDTYYTNERQKDK